MRTLVAIFLLMALSVEAADARRHRHRHHRFYDYIDTQPSSSRSVAPPIDYGTPQPPPRREIVGMAPPGATPRAYGQLVPSSWRMEPPDPNWRGKRFMSPDGSAWFATYTSPVDPEPIADHMKTFAFAEGEEITYLAGARDWIAASGLKGDRIFHRKGLVACGGKVWRHVAFEYSAADKRRMDGFVRRAVAALTDTANDGCEAEAAKKPDQ